MNLLAEGFPILILTAFFVLTAIMPQLTDYFIESFYSGFKAMGRLFANLGGGGA